MPTKQTGKALYRVREVTSPIHKVFRGLRIEVALPNMVGRKPFTDTVCPSFDKPYFICRFGDYETWEYLHKKWPAICRAIFAMGFTEIQEYKPTKEEQEQANEADEAGDPSPQLLQQTATS